MPVPYSLPICIATAAPLELGAALVEAEAALPLALELDPPLEPPLLVLALEELLDVVEAEPSTAEAFFEPQTTEWHIDCPSRSLGCAVIHWRTHSWHCSEANVWP